MQFAVRLFDAGHVQERQFAAASLAELQARLLAEGKVVLSVKPLVGPSQRHGRAAGWDAAWWCKELRTLLAAGMTVVEALDTLHAQPLGRARAQVNTHLVGQLRDGKPLSTAMASAQVFSPVLVASVRAGERTSGLVQALEDYLSYHEMLERLRKQLVSAAIYPTVVVSLGLAIAVFLMLYVMPRFARLYSDLQGPLSAATRLMLSLSRLMTEHLPWLLAAGVLLALGLAVAWQRGWLHRALRLAIEALPALRRRMDEFRLAKLYQTLGLLFKGGYALDDALRQSALLGLGMRMDAAIGKAHQGLVRGQRVSLAFSSAGLADMVSQRLLAVGERTGNFDQVLQTIAQRHSGQFSTFVERATRLVEPLLLLSVALMVGGIVLMMYMPVFDMASSVR